MKRFLAMLFICTVVFTVGLGLFQASTAQAAQLCDVYCPAYGCISPGWAQCWCNDTYTRLGNCWEWCADTCTGT